MCGCVDMFSTIRRHWKEIISLIYLLNMISEFLLTWLILTHTWWITVVRTVCPFVRFTILDSQHKCSCDNKIIITDWYRSSFASISNSSLDVFSIISCILAAQWHYDVQKMKLLGISLGDTLQYDEQNLYLESKSLKWWNGDDDEQTISKTNQYCDQYFDVKCEAVQSTSTLFSDTATEFSVANGTLLEENHWLHLHQEHFN